VKLTLSEAEIRRAIQHYVAGKMGREPRDCDVALHPRGRKGAFAIVELLKPPPTLTKPADVARWNPDGPTQAEVRVDLESIRDMLIEEEKIGYPPN
jgi:hypothetical protein